LSPFLGVENHSVIVKEFPDQSAVLLLAQQQVTLHR